ncbi:hypothetical protein LSH36_510g00018 [Paralvinella palmiformis]|uniref:Malonyl-CoA:ACP transacylase (MAT) domain-containing protein n=1 Tax=Paralvinella palmiformis TaxID=53620 RepID=A0AAD9MZ03_9ANNE|nr:hypothetical protein LSH36_510g00018 [Paralvinella palmiformis]
MMMVFLMHRTKMKYACFTARCYFTEVLKMDSAVCSIANYLYPECKVITGNNLALEFLEKHSKEFAIPQMRRLPVSGAFHTDLMKPAQQHLKEAIKHMDIKTPIIPVHSNVNSYKYKHPKAIERFLVDQLSELIKWEQTMHILYSRISHLHMKLDRESNLDRFCNVQIRCLHSMRQCLYDE